MSLIKEEVTLKRTIKRMLKNIVYRLPSSSVLMLHKVTDDDPNSSFHVSKDNFYKLIDSFSDWATMDEVVLNKKKGKIVLSFDDVKDDLYLVAYPRLREKNIPFTIFITLDLLDKEGYITRKQLEELSKDPLVTIGGHCMIHEPLPEQSENKQKYQFEKSHHILSEIAGKKVLYFAYPYGQSNDISIKLLKEGTSYSYAFRVGGDVYNVVMSKNRFGLPRLQIGNKTIDKSIDKLKKYVCHK